MSKSIYIYGFHSIESQLNSNPEYILKLFIKSGRNDARMSKMTSLLNNLKINFLKIDKNELDRLAKGELHQGIIAEVLLPSLPGQEALIDFITNLPSNPLILDLRLYSRPKKSRSLLKKCQCCRSRLCCC